MAVMPAGTRSTDGDRGVRDASFVAALRTVLGDVDAAAAAATERSPVDACLELVQRLVSTQPHFAYLLRERGFLVPLVARIAAMLRLRDAACEIDVDAAAADDGDGAVDGARRGVNDVRVDLSVPLTPTAGLLPRARVLLSILRHVCMYDAPSSASLFVHGCGRIVVEAALVDDELCATEAVLTLQNMALRQNDSFCDVFAADPRTFDMYSERVGALMDALLKLVEDWSRALRSNGPLDSVDVARIARVINAVEGYARVLQMFSASRGCPGDPRAAVSATLDLLVPWSAMASNDVRRDLLYEVLVAMLQMLCTLLVFASPQSPHEELVIALRGPMYLALVRLVGGGDRVLNGIAAHLLSVLLYQDPGAISDFCQADGPDVLVRALAFGIRSVLVHGATVIALSATYSEPARVAFSHAGVFKQLFHMLSAGDPELRLKTLIALTKLSLSDRVRAELRRETQCISLVERLALDSALPPAVSRAAQALQDALAS